MPKCSICQHSNADKINRALVGNGRSLRDIARQFDVSKDALWRHKERHLPETLTKAQEAEEVAEADSLLEQMQHLQERTLSVLSKAEDDDDHGTVLRAVKEARNNLELLAELQGDLARQGTVNVQVDQLQQVVLNALDDRPAARAAVARELYEHDEAQ